MEQTRSITVDGIGYDIGQFSQGVQQAVGIYNSFQADLNKAQLEVIKTQAALQSVGAQIGEAVKKELAEKAAAAKAEADAATAANEPAIKLAE
jgi:hypothetical protein